MELVEECGLCWAFRGKGGTSKGATKGPLARELVGVVGNRERDPSELSVMTRPSNWEANGVEVARGSNSGCKECVEGEPGGETDTRGRGGCHGEPLLGLPLYRNILTS